MTDLPRDVIIRFSAQLPIGAFTREGDTFTFHCIGCAPRAVDGFHKRFRIVHSTPPTLFDAVRGELIDIYTEDQWQRALNHWSRVRRLRGAEGMD